MAENPGVARTRQYIDLFHQGDIEALRDFYSDDVVWHVAGKHRLSGTYRGLEDLLAYFREARTLTEGTLRLEPLSILAGDQHTAALTRVTGRRDGKSLDVLLAQAFKVDADGRWSEYWALANDQDAIDEFWT